MTYQTHADSTLLKFQPDRGVYFPYSSLYRDLKSVLGHVFDGQELKSVLEQQWTAFTTGRRPEVWYQKPGINEWEKQASGFSYPQQLLKNRSSFGLLFDTPFKQLDTAIFVFIEIRVNPKHYYRTSFPFVASFSIRDADANLLEPLESIINDAENVTRSMRFRVLVDTIRYCDGSPIIANPSLLLSTLGRLASKFDERDLAGQLIASYKESQKENGVIGDNLFHFDTGLKTDSAWSISLSSFQVEKLLKQQEKSCSSPSFYVKPNSRISLSFRKDEKVCVLFNNETAYQFPLSIFYPAIDRFVNRKSAGFNLPSLASISERRDWTFTNDDGITNPFGSLDKYLELTFERIDEDIQAAEAQQEDCQELVSTPNGQGKLFCTGLRHREFGSYIYACCFDPDEDGLFQTVKWTYRRRNEDGEDETPAELAFENHQNRRNHGLPYPANWTREPEKLVFQYQNGSKSNIFFNYKHMFNDHLDRIEKEGTDESGIGDELSFEEFQKRFEAAWSDTRKILEANYKNAIPTYYEGDIQLLVPLFLDKRKPSTPSAALVLARDRTGKHFYYAPTFLTLDMARNNALVITRVDDSWLTPNPLPGTIAWLNGLLVDEVAKSEYETNTEKMLDEKLPKMSRLDKVRAAIRILSDLETS